MKPEMIPIKIEQFKDKHNREGLRTNSPSCNPAHVIYMKDSGKYFFEAWEAYVGNYRVSPEKPISTEVEASRFAETKLREMLQEQVK